MDPDYDSITVTISYSDKGEFVTGVDGTVLGNAKFLLPSMIKDQDGRYTMGDALPHCMRCNTLAVHPVVKK